MLQKDFLTEVTKARRACEHGAAADLVSAYLAAHPDSPDPHVEAAHIAFDRGQLDLATEHLDEALRKDPSDQRAHAWQVALLDHAGQPGAALDLARGLLLEYPDSAPIRVALGRTLQGTGDEESALAEYENVLSTNPDNLDATEWRINVIGHLQGYAAALPMVQPALDKFPDAPELFVAAYVVTRGRQEEEDAQQLLERALEIHPTCVPPLRMKINWIIDAGRLDDAVACADKALDILPAAADLHIVRGRALYLQERYVDAVQSFQRATELEPRRPHGPTWMQLALHLLDRYDEADNVIAAALVRMPYEVTILRAAASIKERVGDKSGALALTERAVQLAPVDEWAAQVHVSALLRQHRFVDAERVALAAHKRIPRSAVVVDELAEVYQSQDRDEEALRWYRKAAELSPTADRTVAVVNALRWLNRLHDAESLIQDAIAEKPREPALYKGLAELRRTQRDLEGAVAAYQMALELDETDAVTHRSHIAILCTLRRFADADAAACAAVQVLPYSSEIRGTVAWSLLDRDREAEAEDVLRAALSECDREWPIRIELLRNLSRQGRIDDALVEVEQLLELDPHDTTAHHWKISLLSNAHRYDAALAHSHFATARHQTNTTLRIQLGWLLHDTGDWARALAEFESVCAVKPTIWAVLSRVKALCQLRRFAEAEAVLSEQIRKRPNYAILRYELAWTYWKQAKHKEALVECDHARKTEIGPQSGIVYHAVILRQVNSWTEAEQLLREAFPRYPDEPSLLVQMGLLCDDQNKYAEALKWFDQALEMNRRRSETLLAKSATLRSLGRFGEAEKTLENAIRRSPRSPDLLVEKGWILRDQGQLTRAAQVFTEVVNNAHSPAIRADARRCLGWVAFSGGRYEEARDLFGDVLSEEPNSISVKIGLAWALVRLDDPESDVYAEQLCAEIIEAEPRIHLAHTCLGVLYARQRDFPLAEHHLRRSIELDPFDGSFVDLAAMLIDLERLDEAEELLLKALDRNWYDIQAHIELGRMYVQRDLDGSESGEDARRAGTNFRQALALDPESTAAATGLAVALSRSPGDLIEAERVVRRVISRTSSDRARWPLLLTLARLLIGRGDATQRPELYLESLAVAQDAIERAQYEAEPYFVAGVAAFKAGSQNADVRLISLYRRKSVRFLRRCLQHDSKHDEARRTLTLAEQSLTLATGSLAGSHALSGIAAVLLTGLWVGFFVTDKISSIVLGTMTAVLAGLFALGFVLPHLVRLKLPGGVEADLSASLSQVSAGPTGDLSIGRGRFAGTSNHIEGTSSLSTGPRGELPRLGAASEDGPLV